MHFQRVCWLIDDCIIVVLNNVLLAIHMGLEEETLSTTTNSISSFTLSPSSVCSPQSSPTDRIYPTTVSFVKNAYQTGYNHMINNR